MVNLQQFIKTVHLVYTKALKENICLLIVGGSIGRGNYTEGWSDADLLLVLKKPSSRALELVRRCEKYITKRFKIEIDTMITYKFSIEHTPPKKLHGKIKNFLFFLPKEKVLIMRDIKLPRIDSQKFKYGFWATYTEQEKKFLHRNTGINTKDKQALQALAKKNIKIIFLVLKQYFANSTSVPSSYQDVLSAGRMVLPMHIINYLNKYEDIRTNNQLSLMSPRKLKDVISESVEVFYALNKIIMKRIRLL